MKTTYNGCEWLSKRSFTTYLYLTIGEFNTIKVNIERGVTLKAFLGPLVFLKYINDLPLHTELNSYLFADNMEIGRNLEELFKKSKY